MTAQVLPEAGCPATTALRPFDHPSETTFRTKIHQRVLQATQAPRNQSMGQTLVQPVFGIIHETGRISIDDFLDHVAVGVVCIGYLILAGEFVVGVVGPRTGGIGREEPVSHGVIGDGLLRRGKIATELIKHGITESKQKK
jgi:hypothetical protein